MLDFQNTSIEFLKGVGPQRAEALRKELGIYTFLDLLQHYPFRYIDRTKFYKVNEINAEMPYVQLKGKILNVQTLGAKQGKRLVAAFSDGNGVLELVWFQGIRWIEGKLKGEQEIIVFGKPSSFKGRINITHPEIEIVNDEKIAGNPSLQPVYSSTELLKLKGLDTKGIQRLQDNLQQNIQGNFPEYLPAKIIQQFQFISRVQALQQIHFPGNVKEMQAAVNRIKFEELFQIQIKIIRQLQFRKTNVNGFVFSKIGEHFNSFYKNYLPFELTEAQKRVIKEIRTDFAKGKQMNRLLQGDVGSGKTIVALLCMLIALDNDFQACLMAPTEILASQHYLGIKELLQPMGIEVALLTGSTKTKERKIILEKLLSGELKIVFGTHALIEEPVKFYNLGFAVIDEQHRFGVEQRARLIAKNKFPPHVLVMTATPIPRTLAMTLYGDLDTSVIDELPPGRKPVKTTHMFDEQRLRVIGFMREQIKAGRQIYVVYPLIDESEKIDLKNLMEGYDALEREFPMPEYQISIVHGKLDSSRKEYEMQRFVKKEAQIMIATTVIEVGVNVPNASVMIIENADRFGLAQLHQLRGRVGRGADQSYCILMTTYKLSNEARLRIDTMCRTQDGFEIAEVDLQLRGPGDIEGTQQSGTVHFRLADLAKDQIILQKAREAATQLLDEDPDLLKEENAALKLFLQNEKKNKTNWSKIA